MTTYKKTSFIEKIISYTIITILSIITIAILFKQSSYEIKNFGMISPNFTPTDSAIDLANVPVKNFIPEKFQLYLQKEIYDSENLYEKINGKATLYTDLGFIKLLTQRFSAINNKELWFEILIYDMGSTRSSFSVFSQQRRADANVITTMKMAYNTENAIFITIGNYYIEIPGSSSSKLLLDAMSETGNKIESFFNTFGDKNISELSLFDHKMTVPGSENLYPNDAFGYSGFKNIFTAKYKINNLSTTVFISKKNDDESARKEANGYIKFLLENGGTKINSPTKDVVLIDLFGSYDSIFTYKDFILGVHGADDLKTAKKITTELLNTIKKENP
jgi:hypothetical protein